MEFKIEKKTVKTEVYVTCDGEEYTCQTDAINHEKKLKAEKIFGITYEDIVGHSVKYVVVNSQDELDLLYDYICKICGIDCTKSDDLGFIKFPALVTYDYDSNYSAELFELSSVYEETYRDCKKLCEMYEKMVKGKLNKQ